MDPRRRLAGALLVASLAATIMPPTPAPATAAPVPTAPACRIFPTTNPWNQRVDALPVARGSRTLIRAMAIAHLHPDFSDSDGAGYGIPYQVVDASTPRRHVTFDYAGESDHGPYPIPRKPLIEGGGDRHLITVDRDTCTLRELFAARQAADRSWRAGSGAVFDLASNRLRPAGWTSADAAGLPIFPGLARYSDVAKGRIDHALRFTLPRTQRAYTWPARHYASTLTAPWLPPMGVRIRLKASYDISRFGPQTRIILRAAKQYGLILADSGSAGYITGAPARGWDDDDLHDLHEVPGRAFEVVDTSSLPNALRGQVWNRRFAVDGGTVRSRAFVTAARTVALEALRGDRVVARRTFKVGHGYAVLSMPAVRNARYRLIRV